MPMTAFDDFVVNVSYLEQRRLRPAGRDTSSRARAPRQDAGGRKIMERAMDGHARGAEGGRQFRLGRHAMALWPCAGVNLGEHEALDSLVERPLIVRPPGQFEGALAAGGSLGRFQHLLTILLP